MALAVRVERLEKEVRALRQGRGVPGTPRQERARAIGAQARDPAIIRKVVLDELRKKNHIEAWSFALDHNLHYPSVETFLSALVKRGAIERAE